MSLPFLKPKRSPGLIVEEIERPNDHEGMESVEACAQDIIDAVQRRDAKLLAIALKSAFECLDAMPHEEGPHVNEAPEGSDYKSRNIMAALGRK